MIPICAVDSTPGVLPDTSSSIPLLLTYRPAATTSRAPRRLALPAPSSDPQILLFYQPKSDATKLAADIPLIRTGAHQVSAGGLPQTGPRVEDEATLAVVLAEPMILVGYFGDAAERPVAGAAAELLDGAPTAAPADRLHVPQPGHGNDDDSRLTLLERLELRQDEVMRELDALDLRITKLITELTELRQRRAQ